MIAQCFQSGVDFAAAPAFADEAFQQRIGSLPHRHAQTVISEYFQLFDILIGFPGHHRVHAAGIISDDAADRAAAVGSGIGTEGQVMFLCGAAQIIENDPGLHAGNASFGVELDDLRHVLRKVKHNRDITTLASEGGPSAAAKDGRTMFAANSNATIASSVSRGSTTPIGTWR